MIVRSKLQIAKIAVLLNKQCGTTRSQIIKNRNECSEGTVQIINTKNSNLDLVHVGHKMESFIKNILVFFSLIFVTCPYNLYADNKLFRTKHVNKTKIQCDEVM